ncbi:uncharacterized protein DEA37_0006955 [Paragonimus westermani]|uniref:Uncharacterized protein n=1 Tax=Paragonimus westermani TaxID=34504 RepID=A0A5J4NDW7_9TREM|nr:uncharacterized protein DEA37_0006955 [Paragonimus westermani]
MILPGLLCRLSIDISPPIICSLRLRQHLRIAWNLQLGHSWLLISNILTKYRVKKDKGYIPFLEAALVQNLPDTARELARMLSDTYYRINLTRLFNRRTVQGTTGEKNRQAEHEHVQLVSDRVTRLYARLKRPERLIEGELSKFCGGYRRLTLYLPSCNTYELEDKCAIVKRAEPPMSTYCSSSTEFSVFIRPKTMKLSYVNNNDADRKTQTAMTSLLVPSIQPICEPIEKLENLTGTVKLRERSFVPVCSPESHLNIQCSASEELYLNLSSSRDAVNENHAPSLSDQKSEAVTSFQASALSTVECTPNTLSANHALLERESIEGDLVQHADGDCVDSEPPSVFDRKTDPGITSAWHKTTLEPIIENDFSELSSKSINANTVLSDPVKITSPLQTDFNPISETSQLTTKLAATPNDPFKGDTCHAVVNSVCELESTIDWVSTQLDAVLELGAETEHLSADHTRIPTQLACIQQLIQTMAPLGGQIRGLKQTLDTSELPVCNSLVSSGGPNVRVEVVDGPTAQEVTIDGRGDGSLRNHLRDRLELIRSLRSEKLAHCEQIVCHLEDMHNIHNTLREQLQYIQDKLALVSTQLHDPAGVLWGVQLNDRNGLSEQIESHAVLERELDHNLRRMLYEVERRASQNHMTSLQEQTADVLLELNDLIFVCQQRQNCLSQLDEHLEKIGLLVKEKLSWMEEKIQQLSDLKGALKDADGEKIGQSARSLLQAASCIKMKQPEVQELMRNIDAVTSSGSTTSILSELGVKGPVRNPARFVGLYADLRQTWNELTTGVLLNVAAELVSRLVPQHQYISFHCIDISTFYFIPQSVHLNGVLGY